MRHISTLGQVIEVRTLTSTWGPFEFTEAIILPGIRREEFLRVRCTDGTETHFVLRNVVQWNIKTPSIETRLT